MGKQIIIIIDESCWKGKYIIIIIINQSCWMDKQISIIINQSYCKGNYIIIINQSCWIGKYISIIIIQSCWMGKLIIISSRWPALCHLSLWRYQSATRAMSSDGSLNNSQAEGVWAYWFGTSQFTIWSFKAEPQTIIPIPLTPNSTSGPLVVGSVVLVQKVLVCIIVRLFPSLVHTVQKLNGILVSFFRGIFLRVDWPILWLGLTELHYAVSCGVAAVLLSRS